MRFAQYRLHPERFNGIGYVFAEDDEFCGVDLDACRCADDGRLTSWATAIINSSASYCEVSPSNEGVKLILRGKLPIPDKQTGRAAKLHDVDKFGDKTPEVAVYDRRRFWCLTGHRVAGTPASIEPRQHAIEELFQHYFVANGRKNSPGKTSNGKTSNGRATLNRLIADCQTASVGNRSERDFALCAHAVRRRLSKEVVWHRVKSVGKFAEGGRPYFDRTWDKAEYEAGDGVVESAGERSPSNGRRRAKQSSDARDDGGQIPLGDFGADALPMIVVDPATTPVADTLHQVTDRLLSTGHCFSRADQLVVVHDETIIAHSIVTELAGLLNQHVEFFFVDDEAGEYKPLPAAYGNTWLNQRVERSRLPVIKLFTRNPVYTDDWRLVAPGYDAPSGIYYAGPAVEARDNIQHLDTLLRDFCFKTPADRTNYIGMLLTAFLVPRFIGSKPAALFNGNQPELGKSILAQIIATLRDGHPAETATYNPNDEEFEKRLGAIVRRGVTTIIIDNAKGRRGIRESNRPAWSGQSPIRSSRFGCSATHRKSALRTRTSSASRQTRRT